MKIYKQNNNLIAEIPLRQNSYDALDQLIGETDNLVGVIAGEEYTLSKLIDMSYAGKQPQEGQPILHLDSEDELRRVCKECDIGIIEHETCAYCGEPIYGCHTYGDKGSMCMSCEYKLK